jgi:hypothetical protein
MRSDVYNQRTIRNFLAEPRIVRCAARVRCMRQSGSKWRWIPKAATDPGSAAGVFRLQQGALSLGGTLGSSRLPQKFAADFRASAVVGKREIAGARFQRALVWVAPGLRRGRTRPEHVPAIQQARSSHGTYRPAAESSFVCTNEARLGALPGHEQMRTAPSARGGLGSCPFSCVSQYRPKLNRQTSSLRTV